MTQDSEAFVFLPSPRKFELCGHESSIPADYCLKLEPTRAQLGRLPEIIQLDRSNFLSHRGSYRINVENDRIVISASSDYGWHYGLRTLKQLAQSSGAQLPQCKIEDYPDFENRGVMLDISRNKVPTLKTLYELIDHLAEWKINELQLYIEHAFAFKGHHEVWKDASPLTPEDIRSLDTYCQERFIELVPNLNCFGHMTRWLIHDRYRPLAEQPDGGPTDLDYREQPQGLCATDPRSIVLAEDIIKQMISHFDSDRVNVGCDETIDLGYGRSKQTVEAKGRGVVYLDYLKKIHHICKSNGKSMQFWADIIVKYPDLIDQIPDDCVALDWGYAAIHPFEKETALLNSSGVAYYVCPGTSSWNSIGGRTENMTLNIQSAAASGKTNGAIGFMVTDWGDNGHLQPLLSSFPGLALGAASAWHVEDTFPLDQALDRFVFKAPGWGQLLLDTGNLDRLFNTYIHNNSILYKLLQDNASDLKARDDINIDKLIETLKLADRYTDRLETLSKTSPTDPLLGSEFNWVIGMLRHACLRGLAIFGHAQPELSKNAVTLIAAHKQIWDLRNRPGGYLETRQYLDIIDSQ